VRIDRVTTTLYKPTWPTDPFAARFRDRVFLLVEIHADGLTGVGRGWGEAAPHIEALGELIRGQDPRNVERLWSAMIQHTFGRHGQERAIVGAIGTIDVALGDLLGKALDQPCWRLLGGYRDWVEAYADVPTRAETPGRLGEQLAACVDAGYRAVKFHVLGFDPDGMVAQTRAARQAIDPDVKLMVDIFRYFDAPTAIDVARRIEQYDVHWLEEPVRWDDQPLGMALVAAATRIPVAGGEGESTLPGVRALLERGGLGYLQPNVLGAGGYTPWRKIAALAEAFHVRIAPHGASFPEINSHLVAAYPHGAMVPATTQGQPPEVWSRVYSSFAIQDGRIQLSERPGLGVELDRDYLGRHAL